MSELLNQAKALAPEIVRWRRHIHENPEVSAAPMSPPSSAKWGMNPIPWAAVL